MKSDKGFDSNDNFRGQDLTDNILGQELFFGGDYIENQGKTYKLAESYVTYSVPLLSGDTIIGSASAETLGISGEYFSIVFFSIIPEEIHGEGNRNFTSLNQLYIKDINTIYASVNGYLTFKLIRTDSINVKDGNGTSGLEYME